MKLKLYLGAFFLVFSAVAAVTPAQAANTIAVYTAGCTIGDVKTGNTCTKTVGAYVSTYPANSTPGPLACQIFARNNNTDDGAQNIAAFTARTGISPIQYVDQVLDQGGATPCKSYYWVDNYRTNILLAKVAGPSSYSCNTGDGSPSAAICSHSNPSVTTTYNTITFTSYTCEGSSSPVAQNFVCPETVNSTTSNIVGGVKTNLGIVLPLVGGFLVLSVIISLALKSLRKFGRRLI